MPTRNWTFAGLGMVLTILGGMAEWRHILALGSVSVVLGLAGWVIFSGSCLVWHVEETCSSPRQSAARPVRQSSPFSDEPSPPWDVPPL